MTLLDNRQNNREIPFNYETDENSIPSVYRDEDNCFSMKTSIILSFLLHPAFLGACSLLFFILTLLGLSFDVMNKPDMPKKDIEFVLVSKEAPPINKKTRLRADRNSRAGGKHDPKRRISEPQPATPKSTPTKAAAPAAAPKKVVAEKPKTASSMFTKPIQKVKQPDVQSTPKTAAVAPKAPAPSVRPGKSVKPPRPTVNPRSTMQIPFPKTADYGDLRPSAGGPVAGTKNGKSGGSGTGKSVASAPTPSFSPSKSKGSGYGGSGSSAGRAGGRGSSGNYGNPGPGNPMGVPGIDAVKEPDFGPYMKELQRRIKMNWTPPKGNESKRVVLLFSIGRDGRLISVKVQKSSGLPAADQAAIHAVQLTAPFKPLPPNYKGSSVDIQFTFDYNVFSASKY